MVIAIVCGVIGLIIGFVVAMYISIKGQPPCVGTLRVDRSFPDEPPSLFLEVDANKLSDMNTAEEVTLRIVRENFLPSNGKK